MRAIRIGLMSFVAISLTGLLSGQQQPPPPPPPSAQSAPPEQALSPQQLEDLAAPIALYPDTLLSEILVASTYPLEVVEAQQWLQQNIKFKGKKLMNEAQRQNWDPSVQALVAFPDVLARLNQDVRWTTDLGNAFLAQQADVMAAVQQLRAKAQANGKLKSTPQENVTTANQNGQTAIQIQPVNPETVYVPVYNPGYFWGQPEYGYYPPLFYPPIADGFSFLPGIDLGFYFGGDWGMWGGFGWGWGPDWFGGDIFMNNNFFHRYGFRDFHPVLGGGNVWAHDPSHRLGVAYPNRQLTNQFRGAEGVRGGAQARSGGQARGGAAGIRGAEAYRAPAQRFGTQGFERQNLGSWAESDIRWVPAETAAHLAESAMAPQPACRAITDSPAWDMQDSAAEVSVADMVEVSAGVDMVEVDDDDANDQNAIGDIRRCADCHLRFRSGSRADARDSSEEV